MADNEQKHFPQDHRDMLVRLTAETAEGLEDLQHQLQRSEKRRVTKKELVERAVRDLIATNSSTAG